MMIDGRMHLPGKAFLKIGFMSWFMKLACVTSAESQSRQETAAAGTTAAAAAISHATNSSNSSISSSSVRASIL
jgi:hypothetical protein